MSQQRHEGSEDQDGEHTSTTPDVSPDRKAANVAPPTRNPRAKPATCLFTASLRVAEPSFEVSQVDRPVHRRSHSLTSSATQTRRRYREIANVANTATIAAIQITDWITGLATGPTPSSNPRTPSTTDVTGKRGCRRSSLPRPSFAGHHRLPKRPGSLRSWLPSRRVR